MKTIRNRAIGFIIFTMKAETRGRNLTFYLQYLIFTIDFIDWLIDWLILSPIN